MKQELWKIANSSEKVFKISGIREVNIISEEADGSTRLSQTLELEEVSEAGFLSGQNSVFKTLFAISNGDVDAEGNAVYRGMHRTLFAALQKLGDQAIGRKIKATVAKVITSSSFYAMRKNPETGARELFRMTNGDPILINSFEIVYIDGESRIVDQQIEAQIRQIVRDSVNGGGFVTPMHLDSEGKIVVGGPENEGNGAKEVEDGSVPESNSTKQGEGPKTTLP